MDRRYIEGKESLVSTHLRMVKCENLVRLSPSFYNYDPKRAKCVFLDFCINSQEQYEIISSHYTIGLTREPEHPSAEKLSVIPKMYRFVFYSVIDAMVSYDALKSALRSRGSCIDNL